MPSSSQAPPSARRKTASDMNWNQAIRKGGFFHALGRRKRPRHQGTQPRTKVSLPVRLTLLQNQGHGGQEGCRASLPARLILLQNPRRAAFELLAIEVLSESAVDENFAYALPLHRLDLLLWVLLHCGYSNVNRRCSWCNSFRKLIEREICTSRLAEPKVAHFLVFTQSSLSGSSGTYQSSCVF